MLQTELSNTCTNTLWLLYVHDHQACHAVKVGVVTAV